MENNGGQSAGSVSDIDSFSAPEKPVSAKGGKISGVAVVLMIILTAIGFGGGAVVGGLMAGGTGTADSDDDKSSKVEPTGPSTVDTAMQDEIDKKIDAYESAFWFGNGLRAFHESYLSDETKLIATFATMKDDELSGLASASYPYETTVSLEKVETAYESLFGEELQESGRVNFSVCIAPFSGVFEYNAEAKEYKAYIPEAGGCGGATNVFYDSYRDSYAVEGDKAYVTVEIGRNQSDYDSEAGVYSDYIGGKRLSDESSESDFVNASNKDSFTKYQYVFEKQDSGAWALKGLYPTEK